MFKLLTVHCWPQVPAVYAPMYIVYVVPDVLPIEAGGQGGGHVQVGHLYHTGRAGRGQVLGHTQVRPETHAGVGDHQLAVLGLGINQEVFHNK